MTGKKRILFLQGPTSPLWRELAIALEEKHHQTFKIHVAFGDQLWWFRRGGFSYRGRFSHWQDYLQNFAIKHSITDIIYYADRNPYHIVAQAVSKSLGINAITIENGYLRPDWLTMERCGMGVYSCFPDDPGVVREQAQHYDGADLTVLYKHSFGKEIYNEVLYHGFNYLYRPLFPFFRSGRYYDFFVENITGLFHLFGAKKRQKYAHNFIEKLLRDKAHFYVVALQMQGDKQIKDNSPFKHLGEMIKLSISSFAKHAPNYARLVFKQHPHDNGAEHWERHIYQAALGAGVAERVDFIDGGNLDLLLASARGCITVNSTVGIYAIRAGCPLKPLGIAIYDIPGLTHQGSLNSFWSQPSPVDMDLAKDFIRLMAATIQIKGSFYDPAGRKAAIASIIARIEDDLSVLPSLADAPTTRLEKARAMGIRIC
jgi:capsular polysaccharide export protein